MSSIQDKAIEYIKLVTENKDAQAYLNQFSEKERIDILVSVKWILAYAQYLIKICPVLVINANTEVIFLVIIIAVVKNLVRSHLVIRME